MFSMNETGAEAASATAVEVGLIMAPPAPRQMLFNQPFLYVIRETTTGAILFMGVFRG
jgi:serpin B